MVSSIYDLFRPQPASVPVPTTAPLTGMNPATGMPYQASDQPVNQPTPEPAPRPTMFAEMMQQSAALPQNQPTQQSLPQEQMVQNALAQAPQAASQPPQSYPVPDTRTSEQRMADSGAQRLDNPFSGNRPETTAETLPAYGTGWSAPGGAPNIAPAAPVGGGMNYVGGSRDFDESAGAAAWNPQRQPPGNAYGKGGQQSQGRQDPRALQAWNQAPPRQQLASLIGGGAPQGAQMGGKGGQPQQRLGSGIGQMGMYNAFGGQPQMSDRDRYNQQVGGMRESQARWDAMPQEEQAQYQAGGTQRPSLDQIAPPQQYGGRMGAGSMGGYTQQPQMGGKGGQRSPQNNMSNQMGQTFGAMQQPHVQPQQRTQGGGKGGGYQQQPRSQQPSYGGGKGGGGGYQPPQRQSYGGGKGG